MPGSDPYTVGDQLSALSKHDEVYDLGLLGAGKLNQGQSLQASDSAPQAGFGSTLQSPAWARSAQDTNALVSDSQPS